MTANLTETRGKRKKHTVDPLPAAPPQPAAPTPADIDATTDLDLLKAWWTAHTDLRPTIETRVAALKDGV